MNSIIGNEKAFIAGLIAAIGGSIPDVKTGCEKFGLSEEVSQTLFSNSAYSRWSTSAVSERMAMLVEFDRLSNSRRSRKKLERADIAGWKSVVDAHNDELAV
jgi:hypothetical protein